MTEQNFRIVHDSMGEMRVPESALYGATTARAIENFPISTLRKPRNLIRALALIKQAAAKINYDLGLLDKEKSMAIQQAAEIVAKGGYDDHFPVDIFQTGSGTSSNMNANEVIAELATRNSGVAIHPNDDVNMGQSSNDTFPTAIAVASCLLLHEELLPALENLKNIINTKSSELKNIVKTGRTHLMDAMPITFGQELSGWEMQISQSIDRINDSIKRLYPLAQGGTAIGTGTNAHPKFGAQVAKELKNLTDIPFVTAENYFEKIATQDAVVELSGQIKTLAVSLMKIANDLRWMNSGPLTGLAEIELKALQPGSSIMPGKINPVIPEAVCMVAAQIIGNDLAVTVGGQAGNFELNVMLPIIAHNILQSIEIAANACTALGDKAIKDFIVNTDHINEKLSLNPILITALNPIIGYELGAKIAKTAYKERRPVIDVALDMTDLSRKELEKLLDPAKLTEGGIG